MSSNHSETSARLPDRLVAGAAVELSRHSGYRTINPQTFLDVSLFLSLERFHENQSQDSHVVVSRFPGFFAGTERQVGESPVQIDARQASLWKMRLRAPAVGRWRWRLEWHEGPDAGLLAGAGVDRAGVSVVLIEQGVFDVTAPEPGSGPDAGGALAAGRVSLRDGMLFDQGGVPVPLRSVLDLAQRVSLAPDRDLATVGVGPGALALVDPFSRTSVWSQGRLFALDASSIDAAAASAEAAATAGAVVAVSLATLAAAIQQAAGPLSAQDRGRAESLLVKEIVARFGAVSPLIWIAPEEGGVAGMLRECDPLLRPVLGALPQFPGTGGRLTHDVPSPPDPAPVEGAENRTVKADGSPREASPAREPRRARRPVSPPAAGVARDQHAVDRGAPNEDGAQGHDRAKDDLTEAGAENLARGRETNVRRPVRRWLGGGLAGDRAKPSSPPFALGDGSVEGSSKPRPEPVRPAAERSEKISLSSFWPRPGKAVANWTDEPQNARSPLGHNVASGAEMGLELLLYAYSGDSLEAAERLDSDRRIDLVALSGAQARFAIRVSGKAARRAKSVTLQIQDSAGGSLASVTESMDGMALFEPLAAVPEAAHSLLISVFEDGATAPLGEWRMHCVIGARANPALNEAPDEEPAMAETGLRLDRVDFVDPESDRLVSVWRETGAGPGPMLDPMTMTISLAGDRSGLARRAVATLEIEGKQPLSVETAPIIEAGRTVCVFYNLDLRGAAQGLTVELFDNVDAVAPFATVRR